MTVQNYLILGILALTIAFFIWGRWRHDLVALGSLMACVLTGLVGPDEAFEGFGNPAVITVGAVLVLSKGLQTSGAVDVLAKTVLPKNAGVFANVLVLLILGAFLSAFMNNVGAMALLMPIAIQMAHHAQLPPGRVLMPLAFATILGGMVTLIGTPPNLIVSGYRTNQFGEGFAMFDFLPVGGTIAVIGILFLVIFAPRLVPNRKPAGGGDFDVGKYQTELTPMQNAKVIGMSISEVEGKFSGADLVILSVLRGEDTIYDPDANLKVEFGDILIVQARVNLLQEGVAALGLTGAASADMMEHPDYSTSFRELVIRPDSELIKRTAREAQLATRYGINLVALSRGQKALKHRINSARFKAGDVLLVQGDLDLIEHFANEEGCIPLAERELDLPSLRAPLISGGIMLGSVLCAALGWLPTQIAFVLGAFLMVLTHIVPVRRLYDAIDWPIIVLLAAMLPVAAAMQTTGTADLIARFMLDFLARGNAIIALTIILILTMFMSDVMNNAATAAVMCPIAIQSAESLSVSSDAYLMAVAIGASCAFLTPIGHQNNTLILSPSGFKFGDYWRFGLPLEIVIVIVAIPMLLWVWPLAG